MNISQLEKDTAAYKIFNSVFEVHVPYIYTVPRKLLEQRGMFTTGNKQKDRQNANEIVKAIFPLSRLAEIYSEGCPIIIPNVKDVNVQIELIEEHRRDTADVINAHFMYSVDTQEHRERVRAILEDHEVFDAYLQYLYDCIYALGGEQLKVSSIFDTLQTGIFKDSHANEINIGGEKRIESKPFIDQIDANVLNRINTWL